LRETAKITNLAAHRKQLTEQGYINMNSKSSTQNLKIRGKDSPFPWLSANPAHTCGSWTLSKSY